VAAITLALKSMQGSMTKIKSTCDKWLDKQPATDKASIFKRFVRGAKRLVTAGSAKEAFDDACVTLATASSDLNTVLLTRSLMKSDDGNVCWVFVCERFDDRFIHNLLLLALNKMDSLAKVKALNAADIKAIIESKCNTDTTFKVLMCYC
jgi:hypothetical protein